MDTPVTLAIDYLGHTFLTAAAMPGALPGGFHTTGGLVLAPPLCCSAAPLLGHGANPPFPWSVKVNHFLKNKRETARQDGASARRNAFDCF